jgi:hypothetical protein
MKETQKIAASIKSRSGCIAESCLGIRRFRHPPSDLRGRLGNESVPICDDAVLEPETKGGLSIIERKRLEHASI